MATNFHMSCIDIQLVNFYFVTIITVFEKVTQIISLDFLDNFQTLCFTIAYHFIIREEKWFWFDDDMVFENNRKSLIQHSTVTF